jgi:hypothetical protein
MAFTIDVDYELADKITVQNLKFAYESYQAEINRFKGIEIRPWLLEDLDHAEQMCLALEKVLRYYLIHTDAERYFNGKEND